MLSVKIMGKIKEFIDFGFKKSDLIAYFACIFCFVAVSLLNITEIYENSILENLQLVPLFIAAIICFKAKNHKSLFIIAGLFIILFFFRELSYGRVIYGAIPNTQNEFYPLSHFKYGYLTNVIIGIYIGIALLFGIIKKIWKDIFSLIKEVKFPLWTFLFIIIFIIFEILGEKADNTVLEEIAELTIYCLILSLCLIYKKDK